jgi:uncharacterized protein YbbC (DUF1343 family)
MSNYLVKSGLDCLVETNLNALQGLKLGVIANSASVDRHYRNIVDIISANSKCTLKKIFAPEHGFRGGAQDMESVADTVDPITKLPIISLYGGKVESLSPKPEALKDLDAIVFDLQDVGSRYYTFAQTLGYTMQVCSKTKTKVIVIDRPNPINGSDVEGAELKKSCQSFCGYAPVPNRHGMTMGELGFGKGADAIPAINCDLQIIKMENWRREIDFQQTGLPWIHPSPNMPTLDTAFVYPGMCLFEATNISEGRGTTKPFELIGAPFINGYAWIEEILKSLPASVGYVLRPVEFIPKFQKHGGKVCGGLQIHVTNRQQLRSFELALVMIATLKKLYPKDFAWRSDEYEFVSNVPAIDLLYGSEKYRNCVDKNGNLQELFAKHKEFEKDFLEERKKFLLY